MLATGKCVEAIPLYRSAAQEAAAAGAPIVSLRFLNNLGTCQIKLFQNREALKTLLETRSLAERIQAPELLAGLGSNISSLFLQMGNLPEAAEASEKALIHADALAPEMRSRLLAQLANVRARMGQLDRAEPLFSRAIDEALRAQKPDADAAAWAWDSLADARRRAGRLPQAEFAATQGLLMRRLQPDSALESSYMVLGATRTDMGDTRTGIALLNEAERDLHLRGSRTAPWHVYRERGRAKLLAGELQPALDDLRQALSLARRWRVDIVASDANRLSSEAALSELYGLLIDAGNRLHAQTHDPALIRETFEAAEENRAASLRAILPTRNDWRDRLPPEYLLALARLQKVEAEWIQSGDAAPPPRIRRLRSQLDQLEAAAGAPARGEERNAALDRAQQSLGDDSVLLSFRLGADSSWVWAVTPNAIALHRAPAAPELGPKIRAFEIAAQKNSPSLKSEGAALYASLFGDLDPHLLARKRWLLALDGELFDLPFAALSPEAGDPLIKDHSLQITTGALMLHRASSSSASFGGPLLGIGDPVYNSADERMRASESSWRLRLPRVSAANSPSFARLWGSGKEVQTAAHAWQSPESVILTGLDASTTRFWKETAAAKPAVIHFATHILEENARLRTGWIALSLRPDNQMDYLTPGEIAAHSLNASLVVLSGCSSGKAEIRTASGLMGLTRAWIAAGAGAVVATRWPTVDDDGVFFEHFYRHLRQDAAAGPAAALRLASLDMAESGTWRAKPAFWSGYFLVGNY